MTTDINDLTFDQIANMSTEQLSVLAGEIPDAEDESVTGDSQTPAAEELEKQVEANPESKAEEKSDDKDDKKDEPTGVATKAGDKIIPYAVLEQTRQKAKEAEERALKLEQEKAEAQAKVNELAEKMKGMTEANFDDIKLMTEEEIEAIEEDLPELASSIRQMQATVKTLSSKVAQAAQAEVAKEQLDAQSTVQSAIDEVPKLAFIQAKSPGLWTLATNIDAELRQDPQFQSLGFKERFEKVIEKLEADIGFEIKVESQSKTVTKQSGAPILSIDDIPGGNPPAVNEAQALLERPAHEIAARFENFTLEQIHNFIDRVDVG